MGHATTITNSNNLVLISKKVIAITSFFMLHSSVSIYIARITTTLLRVCNTPEGSWFILGSG
ncbi:hypothetical protein QTP88_027894 [Uroleucon formosanum]